MLVKGLDLRRVLQQPAREESGERQPGLEHQIAAGLLRPPRRIVLVGVVRRRLGVPQPAGRGSAELSLGKEHEGSIGKQAERSGEKSG